MNKLHLTIVLLAIIIGVIILMPPPVTGSWRMVIPNYPSSDGAKWADVILEDGKIIFQGSYWKPALYPHGAIIARYEKIGLRNYRLQDAFTDESSNSATFRPGWFSARVIFDDGHKNLYFTLKRRFWKSNEYTQQAGPAYPPQGVGSADP